MSITCTWTFRLHSSATRDAIADVVEAVMTQLLALEDAEAGDSAVGLDLDAMSADISVTVRGLDHEQALPRALTMIRTAIHAAGGNTADWPGLAKSGPVQFEPARVIAH